MTVQNTVVPTPDVVSSTPVAAYGVEILGNFLRSWERVITFAGMLGWSRV